MRFTKIFTCVLAGLVLLTPHIWVMASGIVQSAYNLIQSEGMAVMKKTTINFTGAGVSVSDSPGATVINIPGGGGGDVLVATVVMTAAEMRAVVSGTPFDLIASPGAGKYILPIVAGAIIYREGAVPVVLTGNGIVIIYAVGSSFGVYNATQLSDMVLSPNTATSLVSGNSSASSLPTDQALSLVIHATGKVVTSSLVAGGANWQVGDTGYVLAGANDATIVIDTVMGGAVLTYHVVTPGTSYELGTVPVDSTPGNEAGIRTAVINAPGLGYTPGDTGTIDGGGGNAAYIVNTVGALGVVTSISITDPGSGYTAGSGVTTTPTSGAGSGLTVDTTVLGSGLQISIDSVQPFNDNFDGTFTITIPYTVVTLP